jgi:peroxiredoxin
MQPSDKIVPKPKEQNVPPLGEGDILPDIILPNSQARLVQLSTHVGNNRQVLLFCPDPRLPGCRSKLECISRRIDELEPRAAIFGITNTTS